MKWVLFILIISWASPLVSQQSLQNTYGGANSEYGRSLVQTADGGYLCIGSSNSYSDFSTNIYVIKLDEFGNYSWGRNLGFEETINWGLDVTEDNDGNILIGGYTNNTPDQNYNGLVIKLNQTGELIWERFPGGADWDFLDAMTLDAENNIYLAGRTNENNLQKGWIIKYDTNGEQIWEETIEGSGDVTLTGISHCSSGLISFIGNSEGIIQNSTKFLSGVIDSEGDIQWVSTHGEWGNVVTGKCDCAENDFYAIGTLYEKDQSDLYIVKQSILNGEVLLNYTPSSSINFIGKSLKINLDGDLVIGGAGEFIFFEGLDAYIVKRDSEGQYVSDDFNDTFGQPGTEIFYDVCLTNDGGYAAIGETDSFENNYQLYFVKIGPNGEVESENTDFLDVATHVESSPILHETIIYPTPSEQFVNIESSIHWNEYRVSDTSGKLIGSGKLVNKKPKRIDLSGFQRGIYLLILKDANGNTSTHRIAKI